VRSWASIAAWFNLLNDYKLDNDKLNDYKVTEKKTPCVSFFMANHYAPYLERKKR